MEETKQAASYVQLEATYPHKLLLCVKKITNGRKKPLQDEEVFLRKFRRHFPQCRNEWKLLQLAYEQNIIDDFFEADQKDRWQKKTMIQRDLLRLVKIISEKYAVILLESLMYIFEWDLSLNIKRVWENSEDERAHFHDRMEVHATDPRRVLDDIFIRGDREIPERRHYEGDVEENRDVPVDSFGESVRDPDVTYTDREKASAAGAEKKTESVREELPAETEMAVSEETGRKSVTDQKPEQVKFYTAMSTTVRKTLRKALHGDVGSQCKIGDYYADKTSSHLDYQEAIRWYEAAAENGYERARFEIGKLYEIDGVCAENGKEKALEIYERLAGQGYPTAQCVLGMKYRLGDGVEENLKLARKWLEKAAMQGHGAAIRNLADLCLSVGDRAGAGKWYQTGAANGDEYCLKKSTSLHSKSNRYK